MAAHECLLICSDNVRVGLVAAVGDPGSPGPLRRRCFPAEALKNYRCSLVATAPGPVFCSATGSKLARERGGILRRAKVRTNIGELPS